MATILGKKLMLFVKDGETYTSIAYATNHTFTTSASTVSVASKDDADVASGAGKWDSQDLDMFSWSISAENLFAYEGNGMTSDNVVDLEKPINILVVKGIEPESKEAVIFGNTKVTKTSTTETDTIIKTIGYIRKS